MSSNESFIFALTIIEVAVIAIGIIGNVISIIVQERRIRLARIA